MRLFAILASLLIFQASCSQSNEAATEEGHAGAEDRLLLTPFLKNGSLDAARRLSSVDLGGLSPENVTSYAGYLTVNETYNSNLFFWFFPSAKARSDEAPLLLWLQGGPGQSSMFGLFRELGPFRLDEKGENLTMNPHSWNDEHNLLFVDNPVGAGFSFTEKKKGYPTNQTMIAEQLYSFLLQFLKIYPEMQSVPLYVCGESFGGKHVLSLVNQIMTNNSTADVKINLEGIIIGNGFIEPTSIYPHAEVLYYIGLIDEDGRRSMKSFENKRITALKNGEMTDKRCYNEMAWRTEATGVPELNNFVADVAYDLREPFTTFLRRADVRRRAHVGAASAFDAHFVGAAARLRDCMVSARPWLERALDAGVRTLLYSGQYDLNLPYSAAAAMYRELEWRGRQEYLAAKRRPWVHGGVLAGYTKKTRNFVEVLVRNAGHMVPVDQPERAKWLIRAFISDYENSF